MEVHIWRRSSAFCCSAYVFPFFGHQSLDDDEIEDKEDDKGEEHLHGGDELEIEDDKN